MGFFGVINSDTRHRPATLAEVNASSNLAERLNESLNIARGYLGPETIPDKLKKAVVTTAIEAGASPERSARNAFKEMFETDYEVAKEMGLPSESLATERGIWELGAAIAGSENPKDIERRLTEGINEYIKFNESGLRRIYEQNREDSRLNFDFESRLEPKNIKKWLRTVGQHKDNETGLAFPEINAQFIEGKIVKRNPSEVGKIAYGNTTGEISEREAGAFEIVKCPKKDLSKMRDLERLAKKQPVARIIIVTRYEKNGAEVVDNIRFLYPHFSINGVPGVDFLERVFTHGKIETEERELYRTEILRQRFVKTKKGIELPYYDIPASYRLTSDEIFFADEIRKSVNPKMRRSQLSNTLWQATTGKKGESSGYVCVDPKDPKLSNLNNEEGEPSKAPPAELQLALVIVPPELIDFNKKVKDTLATFDAKKVSNRDKFISTLLALIETDISKALSHPNLIAQTEFEKAEEGVSTVCFLHAHLPEIAKKLLRGSYPADSAITEKGSVQTSMLTTKLPGIHFISALNANLVRSDAGIRGPNGVRRSLRKVTGTDEYLEAVEEVAKGTMGIRFTRAEVEAYLMKKVRDEVRDFRTLQLFMGLTQMVLKNKDGKSLKGIVERGYRAFNEIQTVDII
ncbi:hypothetical protein HYV12_02315 [Candidatus Dojkabacteria bacterium]|nr:hypothetical protein [Candidatus Dojkabacteria bacterium]